MKNYEKTLPAGYREAFTVNAANNKTGVWLNVIAMIVMAVIVALAAVIIRPGNIFEESRISSMLLTLGAMCVYLVLHELVHGAAYKLLTGQKLTFGFTLTVAYCGVPEIYVYRRASLIALLAPFCVFTVVFGAMTLLMPTAWGRMYSAILLAVHVGGCAGDLYDTWLYLNRFRDPRTLMRDTGPQQWFYVPEKGEVR